MHSSVLTLKSVSHSDGCAKSIWVVSILYINTASETRRTVSSMIFYPASLSPSRHQAASQLTCTRCWRLSRSLARRTQRASPWCERGRGSWGCTRWGRPCRSPAGCTRTCTRPGGSSGGCAGSLPCCTSACSLRTCTGSASPDEGGGTGEGGVNANFGQRPKSWPMNNMMLLFLSQAPSEIVNRLFALVGTSPVITGSASVWLIQPLRLNLNRVNQLAAAARSRWCRDEQLSSEDRHQHGPDVKTPLLHVYAQVISILMKRMRATRNI